MSARRKSSVVPPKDQTCLRIERIEAERQQRRKDIERRKKSRAAEEQRNLAEGNPGDVDFIGMVRQWRADHAHEEKSHDNTPQQQQQQQRICISVRKRPVFEKERAKLDHDSVTCLHPVVWIHASKTRVDGITKYLDHASFKFDHTFDENSSTEDVYQHTTMPLLDFICSGKGGRATVFAYGQTGSGKTHTMNGIQELLCQDLYLLLSESFDDGTCSLENTSIMVSFYELYGGFVQDLLNERHKCKVLEDGKGEINICSLSEVEAPDTTSFLDIVKRGNDLRTTHMTEANDTSSRSHAICQINLRDKKTNKFRGKLSLVDLAGSERGSDTKSHNAQRRGESSEINTSLLALKECIRALDKAKSGAPKHVPYRSSRLTLILKDCFTSPLARTTMIATVSPGASAVDHSLNTLRYADRIKEQRAPSSAASSRRLSSATALKSSAPTSRLSLLKTKHESHLAGFNVPGSLTVRSKAVAKITNDDLIEGLDDFYDDDDDVGIDGFGNVEVSIGKNDEITPKNINITDDIDDDELFKDHATGLLDTTGGDADEELLYDGDNDTKDADFDLSDYLKDDEDGGKESSGQGKLEEELRQTVQALFEQEEAILSLHMKNIQENAELLTEEGKLLRTVQQEGTTEKDIDEYVDKLELVLNRKEKMILALQEKLIVFSEYLEKENELSKKVGSLPQY